MAHILISPDVSHRSPWSARADTLPPPRDGSSGLTAWLAALDGLLASIRSAWWDGSALALSRSGLEALVGLEPGDATPPRLVPAEARVRVRATVRAEVQA